uniref:Uncharacterized protein n=1 Tax=Anguilla anguilla TaxID=7936 RepID=A0A0E9XPV7_ANGAN
MRIKVIFTSILLGYFTVSYWLTIQTSVPFTIKPLQDATGHFIMLPGLLWHIHKCSNQCSLPNKIHAEERGTVLIS